jgi:hypothetical protein
MTEISLKQNTQFSGHAKTVYEKLYDQFSNLMIQESDGSYQGRDKEAEQTRQGIIETIAECDYDLVKHTVEHIDPKDLDVLGIEETVQRIPDLTTWSKEDN